MTDTYPIRGIEPAEATGFFAVVEEAFNSSAPLASAVEFELLTFEFDRSAAAFDGDQIVGTSGSHTFALSVPGGLADTAGISAVGVLPTYRRRGIMSAMIRRQLAGAAKRGEALAALFASESGIYQRFGFGCATQSMRCTIRRGEGTLTGPPPFPGGDSPLRLRVTDPSHVLAEMAGIYATAMAARPGAPARDDRWWRYRIWDPEHSRGGASPLRCLLAEDACGPRGYALYSTVPTWDGDALAANELNVRELMAPGSVASAALWADLLSRDLVGEVRIRLRPVDDALLHLLADRRRARAVVLDNLWIRLVDVPGALRQRRYARAVDVVIEVTDPLLPGNTGRWRLSSGGPDDTPSCERTSAPADVLATAAALGAAYLGGTRLGALAEAGQVAQQRPGALAELSAAMSWDPAPWCPMIF
ncbi:MAG: GNAT family N-acetyltransferase [Streptosporangiaceae bacterium]